MPNGKPAGIRCIHLTESLKCAIYNSPDRPEICAKFMADPEICGNNREEAMQIMQDLEK